MSTIQIQRDWQPKPEKNLVQNYPVKEGAKFYPRQTCVICSVAKIPYTFGQERMPLVMACPKCGHKSWANAC